MPRRKGLRATRPNLGNESAYARKLERLVLEMHNSVLFWLIAEYRVQEPRILAMDSRRPADELASAIGKLLEHWLSRFESAAITLAKGFANRAQRTVDNSMTNAAKQAGMLIKFKPSRRMQDAYAGVVQEQVGLIKSIPTQYLNQVSVEVMQSVQRGRDLGTLSKSLQANFGSTRKRAALIARDQNNKATSVMTRVRQLEVMGDDATAEWLHSGAGRHPRPAHVAAHGRTYKVSKGCFISGEYIFPGEKINCRCTSRVLFPAFD